MAGCFWRSGFSVCSGFPGETEAEYEELMDFVDEMEFDRLGVFAYSPEEGTPAADMEDQVPEEVKEARRDGLMELQQEISFEKAEEMVGQISCPWLRAPATGNPPPR